MSRQNSTCYRAQISDTRPSMKKHSARLEGGVYNVASFKVPDSLMSILCTPEPVSKVHSSIDITNNKTIVRRLNKSKSDFVVKEPDDSDGFIVNCGQDTELESNQSEDAYNDKANVTVKDVNSKKQVLKDIDHKGSSEKSKFIGTNIHVYRAEVTTFASANLEKIVYEWARKFKFDDNCPLSKDKILKWFINNLKNIIEECELDKKTMQTEIYELINDMPIDVHHANKCSYFFKLAQTLTEKLLPECDNTETTDQATSMDRLGFKIYIQPTFNEMKSFVKNELKDERSLHAKFDADKYEEIENDICDILIDSVDSIKADDFEYVEEELMVFFKDSVGLYEQQAKRLTIQILTDLKQTLNAFEIPWKNEWLSSQFFPSENNSSIVKLNVADMSGTDKRDNGIDSYLKTLILEINEWIMGLPVDVPVLQDKRIREKFANNLAQDIVDRQAYLEINSTNCATEDDELEYLKYQVFKCIDSLIGERCLEPLSYTRLLWKRIKRINVGIKQNTYICPRKITRTDPTLSKYASKNLCSKSSNTITFNEKLKLLETKTNATSTKENSYWNKAKKLKRSMVTLPMKDSRKGHVNNGVNKKFEAEDNPRANEEDDGCHSCKQQDEAAAKKPCCKSLVADCCAKPQNPAIIKEIQRLNDEYNEFLRDWISRIPIPVERPEQEEIVKKLRIGFFNGVWNIINKMKSVPRVLLFPLEYQDVFDEQVEILFSMIPDSDELKFRKGTLKAEIVEKTSKMNEDIKKLYNPVAFRPAVNLKVSKYVPRFKTHVMDEDAVQLEEDLKVGKITDMFLIYSKYKENDRQIAEVYRKKVEARTREYLQDLKENHPDEMRNINTDSLSQEIIQALEAITPPSDETIRQEQDEVMLRLLIEDWANNLPIARNNSLDEQIKRKRLRDMLAKKILEYKKSPNTDVSAERLMKHEVSVFLEKLPLLKDASLHMNIMVDRLTNKLNDMDEHFLALAREESRTKVSFDDDILYENFAADIAANSSRIPEAGFPTSSFTELQMPPQQRYNIDTNQYQGYSQAPPTVPRYTPGAEQMYQSMPMMQGQAVFGEQPYANMSCPPHMVQPMMHYSGAGRSQMPSMMAPLSSPPYPVNFQPMMGPQMPSPAQMAQSFAAASMAGRMPNYDQRFTMSFPDRGQESPPVPAAFQSLPAGYYAQQSRPVNLPPTTSQSLKESVNRSQREPRQYSAENQDTNYRSDSEPESRRKDSLKRDIDNQSKGHSKSKTKSGVDSMSSAPSDKHHEQKSVKIEHSPHRHGRNCKCATCIMNKEQNANKIEPPPPKHGRNCKCPTCVMNRDQNFERIDPFYQQSQQENNDQMSKQSRAKCPTSKHGDHCQCPKCIMSKTQAEPPSRSHRVQQPSQHMSQKYSVRQSVPARTDLRSHGPEQGMFYENQNMNSNVIPAAQNVMMGPSNARNIYEQQDMAYSSTYFPPENQQGNYDNQNYSVTNTGAMSRADDERKRVDTDDDYDDEDDGFLFQPCNCKEKVERLKRRLGLTDSVDKCAIKKYYRSCL